MRKVNVDARKKSLQLQRHIEALAGRRSSIVACCSRSMMRSSLVNSARLSKRRQRSARPIGQLSR
jgi:hypothetical protein